MHIIVYDKVTNLDPTEGWRGKPCAEAAENHTGKKVKEFKYIGPAEDNPEYTVFEVVFHE